MHVPSGLPYLYDPQSHDGVPIALHLQDAAQWCADNGIPLHDPRNPNTELRDFAIAWRKVHDDEDQAIVRTMHAAADVSHTSPGSDASRATRYRDLRAARNEAWKAKIKKRRKLQKKRGVR